MAKVLEGVRVVEHGTFITGPAASMLLADLGADVVKVEQPGGRPVPRLQGRQLQPALPDLQPQQEERHARHAAAADLAKFDALASPKPTSTSRTSAPAWPSKLGAGEAACAS
jgi:crotonobetainyl-CoA:carnitine CoA-transferase CaiB-like acyl-CoA transferase